jgi:hypothetical protein
MELEMKFHFHWKVTEGFGCSKRINKGIFCHKLRFLFSTESMMDLSFHRKVIEGSEYLDESDNGIVFKKLPIFISDRIDDKIKTIKK